MAPRALINGSPTFRSFARVSRDGIFKCNFFFCLPALVRADFTTGQIAYMRAPATLNTVYFGDLSEAGAGEAGFLFEKAIPQTD